MFTNLYVAGSVTISRGLNAVRNGKNRTFPSLKDDLRVGVIINLILIVFHLIIEYLTDIRLISASIYLLKLEILVHLKKIKTNLARILTRPLCPL